MTVAVPPTAQRRMPPVLRTIFFAGLALLAALWLACFFDEATRLLDLNAAMLVAFFLLFTSPFVIVLGGGFVLAICAVIAFVLRRPVNGRGAAAITAVVAVALVAPSFWGFIPRHRFERHVIDPMPRSVTGLRIGRSTSFNDGSAWFFAFTIAPADFERLKRERKLVEQPVDWQRYDQGVRDGEIRTDPHDWAAFTNEDAMSYWDGYVRPAPRFHVYVGTQVLVVTDAAQTHVQLMIDHWRYPKTPQ